jgi:tetratricopeptide (TPR) repeat protein
MFEYLDYHASVQHSRRVLELCEEAVELASRIGVDGGGVLGGGVSDYDLAWGAIERAYTLLNNLEDALSKLNDLNVSVVKSVLDDARGYIELAETQLNDGELDAAEGSVNEAMSLLGQAMDLLKYVSRVKKIDKVLTRASEFNPIFYDILDSWSSLGWLNESATQLLQEETDTLLEDDTEPLNDEGLGISELEDEPVPEEKSNNGNPQNEKEPVVEDEPQEEDPEDNSVIDELVEKIKKWYDRKKDKKDKDD